MPTRELILNAHASTVRMECKGHHGGNQGMGVYHHRDDYVDFNVGVRGYCTQASTMALEAAVHEERLAEVLEDVYYVFGL